MANRVKTVLVSGATGRVGASGAVPERVGARRTARSGSCCWPPTGGRLEISEVVGCSTNTVMNWRAAYARRGLAGLDDRARLSPGDRL